ncbi:MAG: hypothetical protein K0R61_4868 [Microvirga sp.]|jgi:hypothetical protein|nr:hypothetical protein [Microvirga sp.]
MVPAKPRLVTPMHKLAVLATLIIFAAVPSHAGPAPFHEPDRGVEVILAGDREKAAIGGAIVGGALGVMLGAAATRNTAPPPAAYARPAPPPEMEEDEPEPVIVRPRRERRVVEVEEEVAPEVVEEECVMSRSRTYDRRTGETIIRRERRCD